MHNLDRTQQNSILRILRDITFVFVILWLINPQGVFRAVYNWNIYGAALLLWIGCAYLSDRDVFIHCLQSKKLVLIWLWPLYLMIGSMVGHTAFSIKQFTTPFIFVFFIYYLYAKKTRILKFGLAIVALYIMLTTINTFILNSTNSQVSRYLAHANSEETLLISSPFLANFAYMYSLTGCVLALVGGSKVKYNYKQLRVLYVIVAIWMFVVIISTQYVLAITSVFILSCWMFLFFNNRGNGKGSISLKNFIVFSIVVVTFSVVVINFESILRLIYEHSTGDNIRFRISSILTMIQSNSGIMSLTRPQLYLQSLETFTDSIGNFIFGVGYYAGPDLIGEHSTIFDTLGRYGIIGGMAWFASIIPAAQMILRHMNATAKNIYKYVLFQFAFELFVNPIYYDLVLVFFYFLIPYFLESITKNRKNGEMIIENNS